MICYFSTKSIIVIFVFINKMCKISSVILMVVMSLVFGIHIIFEGFNLEDVTLGSTWINHWMSINSGIKQNSTNMPSLEHEVPFKKATFGMGCFWANDALFGSQQGVLRTRVGYSGGTTPYPVYKQIEETSSANDESIPSTSTANPRGDHTEVIEIDYDPKVISYQDLLRLFFNNHEYGLTTIIKRQYMSLILFHDEEQKRVAELEIKVEAGKRNEKLVTEIAPAGPFYPAEDYHQKYRLQKHIWILEELNLAPEQLQSSQIAAKLNGYIAGVGTLENFEKDVKRLGIPEKIASFVKIQLLENYGGSLYC